jgi:LuxR family maltose regulon positive regulatory protein
VEHTADDDWELQSLAWAQIAAHRAYGRPDLAPLHGILSERIRRDQAADRDDQVIQLLALQALAWQAEGQMGRAMAHLERALDLAARHRYAMTFVQHGAPMEALLREAAARRISTPYVGWLLSALEEGTRDQGREEQAFPRPAQQPLLEPLSQRELEVLRLLSSSLTGPQIADELSISVATFRSHTKSIYGKLGVHSRIEAIERARDLDLL